MLYSDFIRNNISIETFIEYTIVLLQYSSENVDLVIGLEYIIQLLMNTHSTPTEAANIHHFSLSIISYVLNDQVQFWLEFQ